MAKKKQQTALSVQKGISMPESVNKNLHLKKKLSINSDTIIKGLLNGERAMLSKAITLVESRNPKHFEQANHIIEHCLPHSGKSIRIGVTGVPGAGKSTFIEALGLHAIAQGHKVAVLAIDPSSERSKGSILGDKTRMVKLSAHENAFIRPSPSAGTLGGVAQTTRESIILCEAAGYDYILIETVGVGQSETAVHSMTDFFLLLMLTGAGDDLQGIKRGVLEMTDMIAVNKADGDNAGKALMAKSEIENAIHLFPAKSSEWKPQVLTCSALEKTGIDEIFEMINRYKTETIKNGYFEENRKKQNVGWLYDTIYNRLKQLFFENPQIKLQLNELEQAVKDEKISPFQAGEILINTFRK